jgi:hypothetical protein
MSSGLPVIRLGIVVLDEIDPELYWLVRGPCDALVNGAGCRDGDLCT